MFPKFRANLRSQAYVFWSYVEQKIPLALLVLRAVASDFLG